MSIPQNSCSLCYHWAKNFHNRSKFDKVLTKKINLHSCLRHGVFSDRWRLETTWRLKSSFSTWCRRLAWDHSVSTPTGCRSIISVNRVTSSTTSSVITRHFIATPSTFCAIYLASVITQTSSFPPPISTVETETRVNFWLNSMAIFRRKPFVVCFSFTREITRCLVLKFRTLFAKRWRFSLHYEFSSLNKESLACRTFRPTTQWVS